MLVLYLSLDNTNKCYQLGNWKTFCKTLSPILNLLSLQNLCPCKCVAVGADLCHRFLTYQDHKNFKSWNTILNLTVMIKIPHRIFLDYVVWLVWWWYVACLPNGSAPIVMSRVLQTKCHAESLQRFYQWNSWLVLFCQWRHRIIHGSEQIKWSQ